MTMDYICSLIEHHSESPERENVTYLHVTNNSNNEESVDQEGQVKIIPWTFLEYSKHVLVPLLCVIGILGNLLNLSILGKRIKEGVDTMEKGALVGMMALAASDFLFCIVTISGTYLPTQIIHIRRNLAFYYTMYGNCINNILIKTSTWFTVILAASRHFAVAHPIKARQYMRCGHTVGAILLCMCLLIALHIPLAYLWEVQTITCPGGGTADVLVSGKFVQNTLVKNTFNYIWFISGFAIPVFILAYCNIRLIYSLKMSTTLRENDEIIHRGSAGRAKQSRDSNQRRISMTLIAIVTMFFLLIFPSEIAHFYEEIAKPGDGFNVVITTCNMLQVINFSANFILYCIVNAYFRKTLRSWIRYLSCRKGQYFSFSGSKRIGSTYSVTMSTKHSIVTQNSNVDNGINQSGISL